MSCLNVDISKFESVHNTTNPVTVNLIKWLCDESEQSYIRELRTFSGDAYKKRKKQLSGITPSGTFSNRSESGLIEHSGLIQFDIDAKENPANMDELKYKIQHNPYVAYLSYSTSGNGLWGLIPVKHPERHKGHVRAIQKAFLNAGVSIDPAPSNVASFRFTTYDADPYFNHNAELFPYLIDTTAMSRNGKGNRMKVEQLINKILESKVDITEGYDNWLKIGFALADEFGESGRNYFHQVSQWHSEYNVAECNRQYTNCIKANGKGVTIASFFGLCKDFDVTLDKFSYSSKR